VDACLSSELYLSAGAEIERNGSPTRQPRDSTCQRPLLLDPSLTWLGDPCSQWLIKPRKDIDPLAVRHPSQPARAQCLSPLHPPSLDRRSTGSGGRPVTAQDRNGG